MNYDNGETAYILYACNLHKERGSMRSVAVTDSAETLYAVIGSEILKGNMDYRGFSEMKGFGLFREDYKANVVAPAHLDYGFIEQQPLLTLGSRAVDQNCEKAYEMLNMSDKEYFAMQKRDLLKIIDPDSLRQILGSVLDSTKDDEISNAGFDLKEFYADPDECEGALYTDEQEDEEDAEL